MSHSGARNPGEPGRASTAPDLFPLVYEQLRLLARALMSGERPGHTLQPTALVSEAYLRLANSASDPVATPGEYYRAAAEAMRRILIEHARKRAAAKRGGGWKRTPLDEIDPTSDEDCGRLLALDEAILRLEQEDERAAQIVRLRFYAGLSVEQTVEATGLSRRTVLRDWEYARAWLAAALRKSASE